MLDSNLPSVPRRDPWNKGRLIGQKRPLKPKDVWSIRVRLQVERRARNLALFNLAIDSKLRGCDLVRLQVDDVSVGGRVRDRATIVQKKTGRPVQFEITEQTRAAIQAWLADIRSRSTRYLFPSRVRTQPHLSTRQCFPASCAREAAALLSGCPFSRFPGPSRARSSNRS